MKKFYFALAALAMGASSMFAQDYYLVGDNVNGASWALADENAKFELDGDVYKLHLDKLGSGFKINDGTWDNDEVNFGSSGEALVLGDAYEYGVGGSTGNIAFADDVAAIEDVDLVLDITNATLTVTGTPAGSVAWYITGTFNNYALDNADTAAAAGSQVYEMTLEDNVLTCNSVNFVLATAAEGAEAPESAFKISNTGWAKQYGHGEFSEEAITAETLTSELAEVGSEDGMPYTIEGDYKVTFDLETLIVTLTSNEGVADVAVDANAPVVYYNLRGVRVDAPAAGGVYIVKRGNEASKIVK